MQKLPFIATLIALAGAAAGSASAQLHLLYVLTEEDPGTLLRIETVP